MPYDQGYDQDKIMMQQDPNDPYGGQGGGQGGPYNGGGPGGAQGPHGGMAQHANAANSVGSDESGSETSGFDLSTDRERDHLGHSDDSKHAGGNRHMPGGPASRESKASSALFSSNDHMALAANSYSGGNSLSA